MCLIMSALVAFFGACARIGMRQEFHTYCLLGLFGFFGVIYVVVFVFFCVCVGGGGGGGGVSLHLSPWFFLFFFFFFFWGGGGGGGGGGSSNLNSLPDCFSVFSSHHRPGKAHEPASLQTSWLCSQLKERHNILTSVDGNFLCHD